MDLIIKPTGVCNFKCTFCSASKLNNIQHPSSGRVHKKLEKLIKDIDPGRLIITGGEPLCVPPSFYYELHEIKPDIPISMTSNLKDFFHNPEKWAKLFNEPWLNVITSFNYGETRKWDNDTVYTEEMFLKIHSLFKEITGKSVPFIAIIDDSNYETIMEHVYLAKRLGTQCKINAAVAAGSQTIGFPRWKMFKTYLDIIKLGLDEYEMTCDSREQAGCCLNVSLKCQSTIRCVYVNKDDDLEYSICDETMALGHRIPVENKKPPQVRESASDIRTINDNCLYCDLFAICNGCPTHRKQPIDHCENMMKLKDDIINTGWRLR